MRRPLRASLVLTIASSAAACARPQPIATNPPPVETHNPPAPQAPPEPAPAAPPACPATLPQAETPCAADAQRCGYEACGIADGATAECVNGVWRVALVTCNPPPPPQPPSPPPARRRSR